MDIIALYKKLKSLRLPKKAFLIMGLVLLALIYFTHPFGLFSQTKQKEAKIGTVTKGDLTTSINASGIVQAQNQSTISFLTAGRVAYLGFSEGQEVKKGQVIASLDQTEALQAVSKSESNLRSAQSDLAKVLDDTRLWKYGNKDFTGETQTQKNLREEAEAARDSAYFDLQKARKQLEWTSIIAPFDGVISDITGIEVGQNVTLSSGASVTVIGSGELRFVANVDEIDFAKLSLDQAGEVVLDAYPDEKISGQIVKMGVSATKLSSGGSVIPVEISLPKDNRIMPGLNGEVTFNSLIKENVLLVPSQAIHKEDGQSNVFVLDGGRTVKRQVEVGKSLSGKTEILSGLKEGEKVVLDEAQQ